MEGFIILAIIGFVVYFIIKNAEKFDSAPMSWENNQKPPQSDLPAAPQPVTALPTSTLSKSMDYLFNLLDTLPQTQQQTYLDSLAPAQAQELQEILDKYRWDRTLPASLTPAILASLRGLYRFCIAASLEAHLTLFSALDEMAQAQVLIALEAYGGRLTDLLNYMQEQGKFDPSDGRLRLTMDFKGRVHRQLAPYFQDLAQGNSGQINLEIISAAMEKGLPFYEVFPLMGQDIALVLQ